MAVSAPLTLSSPVSYLSGVGRVREEQLTRLGIFTLRDLLYHFPRGFEDRGDLHLLGEKDTSRELPYMLTVATEVRTQLIRKGMTLSKFRAFDSSGSVEVVFFNSTFVKDIFHVGGEFRFYGKLQFSKKGALTFNSPKYEPVVEGLPLDDLIPLYPLTEGLSSKMLRNLIKTVINDHLPKIVDFLPEQTRLSLELPSLGYALKNIHFPESKQALERSKRRLAFDELLLFALGISISSQRRAVSVGAEFKPCSLKPLTDLLPYELTNSQKMAINDIYKDTVLSKKSDGKTPAMSRIIVGDVGCGKTVCAAAAIYIAASSGYQSALMVPTEILAAQHYLDLKELFDKLGIAVELLTGSTPQKKKDAIYSSLESGETKIVIGTHALLSDKVSFSNLGLIITDEQHRFGVAQRAVLKEKVNSAHMLVMSATPIPRTLALAIYGDLDVSRITELPKGRQRVDTFVVDETYRSRLNSFIEKQVSLGGQCYVVCPSIEKNDDDEEKESLSMTLRPEDDGCALKSAEEYSEELRRIFPSMKIECLHGRIKAKEKDGIMSRFASGEVKILVSTTVIEVGVNVPNASLMIVENAERFGLSQLHQLRGRVGRGKRKSYCVLVSDAKGEKSTKRLEVMRTTYDGYEIAEKDLLLRGPGDFFSSISSDKMRQSGGFTFKIASDCDDTVLFDSAFETAKTIIANDPELQSGENRALRHEVNVSLNSTSTIS